MTQERHVKMAVKNLFKKYGVHYIMPVQNGMGTPALDFHCCVNGYYLAIETKAPGRRPTPRQNLTMQDIRDANGYVMVVDSTDTTELEVLLIAITEHGRPQW